MSLVHSALVHSALVHSALVHSTLVHSTSSATLATFAPSSSTLRSPTTTMRAAASTSPSDNTLAVSSGLIPAGSPIARAIVGRSSGNDVGIAKCRSSPLAPSQLQVNRSVRTVIARKIPACCMQNVACTLPPHYVKVNRDE